ncbi:MAG: 50S ribosomal protein L15, partial [Candidatus Izemoplasmatales bacterium]|nr:50S ribosomal protein L15 [Candidatus Izemoplasmatales bacterium]
VRLGFEGGQTPLFKRLPKRGFSNFFRKEFAIVNVSDLNRYDDDTVITPELLMKDKVIRELKAGLKVLADGKLERKLHVKAHKFSASAEQAIASAGGTIEVI